LIDQVNKKFISPLQLLRSGDFESAVEALAVGEASQKELSESIKIYHAELVAQSEELIESQAKLQEAALRFQHLFEAIPLPVFVTDRRGLISRANAAARGVFALQVSRAAVSPISRLFADEVSRSRAHALLEAEQISEQRTLKALDFVGGNRAAFVGDLHLDALESISNEGLTQNFICVVVDLSEQKAAEEQQRLLMAALREREKEVSTLAQVVRSTNHLVLLADANANITWVNDAFVRTSGYSLDELIGRQLEEVVRGTTTEPGPTRQIREIIRAEKPVVQLEVLNTAKDGRTYWLLVDILPMMGAGRELSGYTSVLTDITSLKAAQISLRRSEAFQRAVFEADPDLVAVLRPDGVIVQLNGNGAKMLGYGSGNEGVGLAIGEVIVPSYEAAFKTAFASAMSGRTVDLNAMLKRRDDSFMDARLLLQPLVIQQTVEGAVLIGRDRTVELQRTMLESRTASLEAMSAAKTRFLAHISHEFRTPLNAILGFTQLIDRTIHSGQTDRAAAYTRHVLHAGEHLLRMVDDLLDLSRVEASAVSLNFENIDLREVIVASVELLSKQAVERGIALDIEKLRLGVTAYADRQRCQQIILNLVSNAIKYNRTGGKVDLRSGTESEYCWFSVTDEGPGLSNDQVANLFQAFNRLGAEGSAIQGTGIGLVITKQLAELMSGAVSVESALGHGTVFRVRLPLGRPELVSRANSHEARFSITGASGKNGPKHKVLCVEDNAANNEFFGAVIGLLDNCEFVSATSAEEALVLMKSHRPSLLLLDVQLPGMSGIEFKRMLNLEAQWRDIPCIMVTANVRPEYEEEAKAENVSAFVSKPVDLDQFLRVVATLLPNH
jgi:PAS domain S-box-containing protein